MDLNEALRQKREAIVEMWVDRTLDGYGAATFFKQGKDRFANPVGANIREGLRALFDLLVRNEDPASFNGPLDKVIRIRAVQEFTPGQAVAPILELKWVVRSVLAKDKATKGLLGDLQDLDLHVDRAALAAFDLYTACREQLYQNRVRELKSGTYVLTDSKCPSQLLRK